MQAEISTEMQDEIRSVLSDYGKTRERLTIRLCNREKNTEWLDGVVHRDFLDFAIVPYIDLSHITGFPSAGAVPYGMIRELGIPEDVIINDALENSPKVKPAKISPLSALMNELMGLAADDPSLEGELNVLTVVTTDGVSHGAAAVLYPDVLKGLADEKEADLLLIPSSVNEFLILADDKTMTKEELEALIREVNHDQVAEKERLSDYLYRYDRETGEIRRA